MPTAVPLHANALAAAVSAHAARKGYVSLHASLVYISLTDVLQTDWHVCRSGSSRSVKAVSKPGARRD